MRYNKILSIIMCAVMLAVMLVPAVGTITVSAATTETVVYVASTGSDNNNGSQSAPFATLQKAWTNSNTGNLTIVIVDTVVLDVSTVSFIWGAENKAAHTTVKGATADSVLDVSAKTRNALYCSGSLTFEDITLKFDQAKTGEVPNAKFYCNGNHVIFAETVKFGDNAPINIFAGGNNKATGSTNLELYGGYYYYIYGGGEGDGSPVNGDVNLTIGGNVNAGEHIDDNASNVAQARIYGGGYKAGVTGDVNINYGGNAVARVLTGTGRDGGEVGGRININMTSGQVTTISASKTVHDTDAKVFINMTGGLCEAIFGGAESTSITGDVQIYLGANADVSRRVFGGCYNNTDTFGFSFKSSNHVIGTVTVLLEPGAKVGSGTGLSSANKIDMGLYGSSRYSSGFGDEVCTLVFLNGNSASNYKIGGSYTDRSDYKVTVGAGGTVKSAMNGTAALTVYPDEGKWAVSGSEKLLSGETLTLSSASASVTFEDIVKYNVTLNANNGTDNSTTVEKIGGRSVSVAKDVFKTKGKTLVGWATSADATVAEYANGFDYTADEDVTLYAVWEAKLQEYDVLHMIVNGEDVDFHSSETLSGRVGEMTNAQSLGLVGYNCEINQDTIVADELSVIIAVYTKTGGELGDMNCDGAIDMLDAVLLLRHLAEWDGYDDTKTCNYTRDVNGDGVVDTLDAVMLKKLLADITE